MNSSIFLVQSANSLVEMRESGYVTEAVLQTYLADHPALLAGEQMSPESPRRWLLVSQEMGIPHGEDAPDRWSVDHLFLDQDAVPTLVETKRSTDSRIRREVVGQMLDYAANGVVYWPVEKLRTAFQLSCEKRGVTTDMALAEFFGGEVDADEFWQRVETNLKAGRVRMVFVADVIPTELRRIVEFLNEQMDPAEVLAVEIKQFVGEGLTTLVPRVLGVTAATQAKQQNVSSKPWDEQRFCDELVSRGHADCIPLLKSVMSWAAQHSMKQAWGRGTTSASYSPFLGWSGKKLICVSFWPSGSLQVEFRWIKNAPGFESDESRRKLAELFNRIDGVELKYDNLDGIPGFSMQSLLQPDSLQLFFDTLNWFYDEVRTAIANTKSESTS